MGKYLKDDLLETIGKNIVTVKNIIKDQEEKNNKELSEYFRGQLSAFEFMQEIIKMRK